MTNGNGNLEIEKLMLQYFRGREDHVAIGTPKGFAPQPLPKPMRPEWLHERHISQQQCLGFYLMTPESCVWCACVDFDNKPDHPDPDWQKKADALFFWIAKAGLCPVMEVSASGAGCHVWLFFDEPTPAWIPRAFFRLAAEKSSVAINEVYPKQDQLSGKGLGNLVRYPLFNLSHFVDPETEWASIEPLRQFAAIRRTSGPELQEMAYRLGTNLQPSPQAPSYEHKLDDNGEAGLSERVKARLAREHSLLARRWKGDRSGLKDQSTSALLLSIACELIRNWCATPEVTAAVRYWCQENSYEKGLQERAVSRCVSMAYDYLNNRMEEQSTTSTTLKDACNAYIDTLEQGQNPYVPSGIPALDQSIDGIELGEVAVIAGRPSHGKSVLALQWCDRASFDGLSCLIISEEMTAIKLGKRALCGITCIEQRYWNKDALTFLRQDVGQHFTKRQPVYIVQNCNTVDKAEEVIAQHVRMHGVKLVAVDYLQLLGARGQNRRDQVTDVSRRLAQSAKSHGIAMLIVSQMNREIEGRPGHEPRLADLRDTGQIEQDADLVIFCQWPFRVPGIDPLPNETDYILYVAKRRDGDIRSPKIETTFHKYKQRIGLPKYDLGLAD